MTEMYVIDTNVISRTSPLGRHSQEVSQFLDRHSGDCFISAVTLGELWFGAERLRARGATRKASDIASWIGEIERRYSGRLLPIDHTVGRLLGEVLARAVAAGHAPGYPDACIAATAVARGFEVVTFNARHFAALGVAHRTPLPGGEQP